MWRWLSSGVAFLPLIVRSALMHHQELETASSFHWEWSSDGSVCSSENTFGGGFLWIWPRILSRKSREQLRTRVRILKKKDLRREFIVSSYWGKRYLFNNCKLSQLASLRLLRNIGFPFVNPGISPIILFFLCRIIFIRNIIDKWCWECALGFS